MELWSALATTAVLIGAPCLVAMFIVGVAVDDGKGSPVLARRVVWCCVAGVAVALGLGIASVWVQVGA